MVITYQELFVRVNEMAALLRDFAGLKSRRPRYDSHADDSGAAHHHVGVRASGRDSLGGIRWIQRRGLRETHRRLRQPSAHHCGRLLPQRSDWLIISRHGGARVETAKSEGQNVDKVLVWRRESGKYASNSATMVNGRDYFVDDLLKDFAGKRVDPVSMDAEAPLFLMYTSGTTGKPKGCQHQHRRLSGLCGRHLQVYSGYPSRRRLLVHGGHRLDYRPLLHCLRALALAATSVIYEGVPNYPGRRAAVANRRAARRQHLPHLANCHPHAAEDGRGRAQEYNYHFKHMTTVGEPIEPQVWHWYYDVVGKREAVIVDTWWQTENGGFLCSTKPALDPMKPGSAGPGVPGSIQSSTTRTATKFTLGSGAAGNICIRNPWPGIMQTIWGDPDRFVQQYYDRSTARDPRSKDWHDWPYFANDGAVLAADGYFRILGRVDDVINVAGHRLGTKELESACLTVTEVAEAAVVPVMDEIKGRMPEIYVVFKAGYSSPARKSEAKVVSAIETHIGKIARPKNVYIVPDMPKTRSGKLMRRVLASISNQRTQATSAPWPIPVW